MIQNRELDMFGQRRGGMGSGVGGSESGMGGLCSGHSIWGIDNFVDRLLLGPREAAQHGERVAILKVIRFIVVMQVEC